MANFLSAECLDSVYGLAEESSAFGQVAKEALDVIESVLNEYE
jgi:hypothetical protein